MEHWKGKVAVVTGASSGIAVETVKDLIKHGLIVVGLARRIDKMQDEFKDVKGPGKFHAKACDITDEKSVIEVFKWVKSTFKTVNVLINCAGHMTMKKVEDTSTEELESTFKVNVFGLLYCTKQAIKLMKENETIAHIVNINSTLGHTVIAIPNVFFNVYPASKFAVTALSESLRNELNDSKIRVTSISPGAVQTPMLEANIKVVNNLSYVPALKPEDVSGAIVYALSAPAHVEINEIILQAKKI